MALPTTYPEKEVMRNKPSHGIQTPSHLAESNRMIGVIGSGDYGRAIAGRIAQYGYTVLIGSRNPENKQIL